MGFQFSRASKKAIRLRAAFCGPAGSGKTYSALAVATALVPGGRVALIDTEHGSASKYGDLFSFDKLELDSFEPRQYIGALRAAEEAGYDVVVIDSLTHAWNGVGGILDQLDRKGGGRFDAWKTLTPQQTGMIEAILSSNVHVIVTMRTKTEYVVEKNEKGKMEPRKIGVAPIQRDGVEYEFDVVFDIDYDHRALASKTRCPDLDNKTFMHPGADVAKILRGWLGTGPVETKPRIAMPAPTALEKLIDDLASVETAEGLRSAWKDHAKAITAMDEAAMADGGGLEAGVNLKAAKKAMLQCAKTLGLAKDETELRRVLAGPPKDDGPKGGGKPAPQTDDASEYTGADTAAVNDTADAASVALADWRTRVAAKTDKFELANSWIKHERELTESGIRDEALRIVLRALASLLGTDRESVAINFVRSCASRRTAA